MNVLWWGPLFPSSEDHGAADASESAWQTARTMVPGNPGYTQLVQLGLARESKSDKESIFVRNLLSLGFSLNTKLEQVKVSFQSGAAKQYILPIRALAEEILTEFPEKLLFGHKFNKKEDMGAVRKTLLGFWENYKHLGSSHPVYLDHADDLHRVIPCRIHMDEGTSHRKHAVMQMSWGPIMKSQPGSAHHCFYFTSILAEAYKDENVGYEPGNSILDQLATHLANHCKQAYYIGMPMKDGGRFFLAFLGMEGDLPAQARFMHFTRHWNCVPNPCCPHCLADDKDRSYADFRESAAWRTTTGEERPWTVPSPLLKIPGCINESFAVHDIFHLCHLGILRTGVVSLLCYLCYAGHFSGAGRNSVPARLHYAYQLFRSFTRHVLGETPHLKDFTRENMGWDSLNHMPESSMILRKFGMRFWTLGVCFL